MLIRLLDALLIVIPLWVLICFSIAVSRVVNGTHDKNCTEFIKLEYLMPIKSLACLLSEVDKL